MADNRLLGFLIDDVKKLIQNINDDPTVQDIKFDGGTFNTFGDFATYWSHHIETLSE